MNLKIKNIKEYLGDIDFYLDQRKVENFREIEKKEKIIYRKKNKGFSKDRSLQKKINNIESKISNLEKEISSIDDKLLNDYEKTISSPNFFDSYNLKKNELDSLMKKWEDLNLS